MKRGLHRGSFLITSADPTLSGRLWRVVLITSVQTILPAGDRGFSVRVTRSYVGCERRPIARFTWR
jgi:hypothetical protein